MKSRGEVSIIRLDFCSAIMLHIYGYFSTSWCRELPKMPKLLKMPKVYSVVFYYRAIAAIKINPATVTTYV